MLVIGVLGTLVALYIPMLGGAFSFALEFYSLTAAFMMPVFLGMIYTRTPWWSGLASCLAAVAVGLALTFLGLWSETPLVRNMFSESLAASLVFFGSAFFYRKDDPHNAEIEAFAEDLKKPVIVDRKEFDPSGLHVYRLLGQISILLGLVLIGCAFLPGSLIAPASINAVAGVLLGLLGALLMFVSRDKKEIAL